MRSRVIAQSIAAVAVAGFVTAAGFLTVTRLVAKSDNAQEVQETVFNQSFSVQDGALLATELVDMDIILESGGSGSAEVRVIMEADDGNWGRQVFEKMRFEATASSDGLQIRTKPEDIPWEERRDRGSLSFQLVLRVPSGLDLSLKTVDGDVSVLESQGEVRVHTVDGDITIGSLSGGIASLHTVDGDILAETLTADEVNLHTVDGDIVTETLAGDVLKLSTADGDIEIAELRGALHASSGDGDVTVSVAEFNGLTVQTGDGDITVFVDASVSATVRLSGEDIYTQGFGLPAQQEDRRRVSGELNGGGPGLQLSTGDGSISLRTP